VNELIQQAKEVGFTIQDLHQAKDEILESSSTKEYSAPEGMLAKKIIDELVEKNKTRPLVGPLPPPRKSP
jgi:hypothetical protein